MYYSVPALLQEVFLALVFFASFEKANIFLGRSDTGSLASRTPSLFAWEEEPPFPEVSLRKEYC